MRVSIQELRSVMGRVCEKQAVPAPHIGTVVEHYLEGELRGKPTHGVAKFCFESQFFPEREGPPAVVRDSGAVAVVDAHREIGPISAMFATGLAVERAQAHGVGVVGMRNTQRYGVLSTWSERIAAQGLLGIVLNTSQADAAVHGACAPVLGVNPISYAAPTGGVPISLDMSTTRLPMGAMWEARRNQQPLQPEAFLDAAGHYTTDPFAATTAEIFGGHKGFGLSLLIQILCGSLFDFPMGREIEHFYDTGYCFLVFDPAWSGDRTRFAQANQRLADQIRQTACTPQLGQLRLPGERGHGLQQAALQSGALELADSLLDRLRGLLD